MAVGSQDGYKTRQGLLHSRTRPKDPPVHIMTEEIQAPLVGPFPPEEFPAEEPPPEEFLPEEFSLEGLSTEGFSLEDFSLTGYPFKSVAPPLDTLPFR